MKRTWCPFGRLPVAAGAVWALMIGLVVGAPPEARAQFGDVRSAERLATAQTTNLFASWTGHLPVQGMLVELPADWSLREAVLLRYGYAPVSVSVTRDGRRYLISAPRPLQGPHELVLRVEAGPAPGWAEWSIVPFSRDASASSGRVLTHEADRVARMVRLDYSDPAPGNRVASFAEVDRRGGDSGALVLRPSALPDLSVESAYTVAFWVKTNRLNEVVASTWDGDERKAYPLEFVVDRSGRLLVYRGQPGRHHSMTTRIPVADGRWHHVALTNEPAAGRARLFLDGRAVDSLVTTTPALGSQPTGLAVGGRLPGSAETTGGPLPFTGKLDELYVLPGARAGAGIQALARPATGSPAAPGRGLRLGFEEPVDAALVLRRTPRMTRTASDLSFYRPVQNFQAQVEGQMVRLTWKSEDEHTTAFVVERSSDGRRFEAVGRVSAAEADAGARFRFRDPVADSQVLYYRIRQVLASGGDVISGTIKLGIGTEAPSETVQLFGNFPNPFNASTNITYELREQQQVRLSVWDLFGQPVATLVDQVQGAGTYEVRFHAGDLPSGTYFVRLETPHTMRSHKLILAK